MRNFACYSYWYLKLVFDAYSMLVHDYYTRKIWSQVIWLVHRNDHRTMGLYTKYTICMLPMFLHDVCTICTISSYELGTVLCLSLTVNMKLYFIKILVGYLFFWYHWFVFVSSHFWGRCLSLQLVMLQLNRGCSLS